MHIDPLAASSSGFPRPILHGLCTFGIASRAVLEGACDDDVGRLKEYSVRFKAPVFPKDVITTPGWGVGDGIYHFQVATETGDVLSNAFARVEGE